MKQAQTLRWFFSLLLLPLISLESRGACRGTVYPSQESSPYVLPYPVGTTHNVRQGNCNEENSHNEKYNATYAYDFEMPIGSSVVAARSGVVIVSREDVPDNIYGPDANVIVIQHNDGTYAIYGHLTQNGSLVDLDQAVEKGEPIGLSGNSGYTVAPHLHFEVEKCTNPPNRVCKSLPVTFQNTRPHPNGLIGDPKSRVGYGQRYRAEQY